MHESHLKNTGNNFSRLMAQKLTSDSRVIAIEHMLIAQFYPKLILRTLKMIIFQE